MPRSLHADTAWQLEVLVSTGSSPTIAFHHGVGTSFKRVFMESLLLSW